MRRTLKPCELCVAGKSKQKNVTKSSDHVSDKDNYGRIFLDIYTIKSLKYIKVKDAKPHWIIMVDESTGLKFSDFSGK